MPPAAVAGVKDMGIAPVFGCIARQVVRAMSVLAVDLTVRVTDTLSQFGDTLSNQFPHRRRADCTRAAQAKPADQ